jgi:Mg2+/Co2+ transporter CorB
MSTVDALRGTVDMYHQQGNFLTEDRDMLSGIFDLGETEVHEVMVHRSDMEAIDADLPIEEFLSLVAKTSRSRIPVWQGSPDQIIGILHTKDLFKAVYSSPADRASIPIRSLLRDPWFVPETVTLKNQLKDFQQRQRHIALVVDEFGSVSGMVTLEDIVEEVLGEIEDEHDSPREKLVKKLKDGSYAMVSAIPLRELNRKLGWDLSDDDATTLAGYVLTLAQSIPEIDEIFESKSYLFKVLKREANQITLIQARRVPPDLASPLNGDSPSQTKPSH